MKKLGSLFGVGRNKSDKPETHKSSFERDYGVFLFWASYLDGSAEHNVFPRELVEHIVLAALEDECWTVVTR
jgi:hypothetical protein